MAELRDEYGNRVELTDQLGKPVELRDEHGNPVHIKGVAIPAADADATIAEAPLHLVPPLVGGERREKDPLETTHHTLGDALKSTTTNDPTTETADVSIAGPAAAAGTDTVGLVSTTVIEMKESGYAPEIQRSPSSTSSSGTSEDDGEGGRRKKKGLTQKIKEKLSGKHNKQSQSHDPAAAAYPPVTVAGSTAVAPEHEKKSVFEKIKDKLPGHGHHNH